jgi:hypothetical protein
MTAKQLAEEVLRMIQAGEISPDTPVVRRFCMCDDDYGWVAVKSVDIVRHDPDEAFGGEQAEKPAAIAPVTIKLG